MEISIRITLRDKATSQINKVETQITQLDLSKIKNQNPKILGENIVELIKGLEEKYNATYGAKGLSTHNIFLPDSFRMMVENLAEQQQRHKVFSWDNPPQPTVPGGNLMMMVYKGKPRGDKHWKINDRHRIHIAEKLEDNTINHLVDYEFPVKEWGIDDEPNFRKEVNRFIIYYNITTEKIKYFR